MKLFVGLIFTFSALAEATDGINIFISRASKVWCENASHPERCREIVRRHSRVSRSEALAFTRDEELRSLVRGKLLGTDNGSERFTMRSKLWNEMNVLILEDGVMTPIGESQSFSTDEIKLIVAGYEQLKIAIQHAVGPRRVQTFAHLWGAGGVVARLGNSSIAGQFGLLDSRSPAQVNVVVNVIANGFSASELAQRIAHENAHSQDVLLGMINMGDDFHWSETSDAKIFSACGLPVGYETEFYACRSNHSDWFNFHPTEYAAYNSAEFYASMVNEWVRVNLKLRPAGRYQCQNRQTQIFWSEMEGNLLGEKVSPECKANSSVNMPLEAVMTPQYGEE